MGKNVQDRPPRCIPGRRPARPYWRGRTPLTINEGISWLLQEPKILKPNHCFMTIGSRKPMGDTLDARTPAIWISGGTGHDGSARRRAPKTGWCWAGNRHTWLGFASARHRTRR